MKRYWWQFWREDAPPAADPAAGCAFKVAKPKSERNWCYYDYIGRAPVDSERLALERERAPVDIHAGRDLVLEEMRWDRVFAPGKRRGIDYAPVIETWERPAPPAPWPPPVRHEG